MVKKGQNLTFWDGQIRKILTKDAKIGSDWTKNGQNVENLFEIFLMASETVEFPEKMEII